MARGDMPDIRVPDSRIGEAELHAYVDEQLDTRGRFEVEEFLKRNPEAAAEVLADQAVNQALRLLATQDLLPVPAVEDLRVRRQAEMLQRALRQRSFRALSMRVAAGVALFALGWTASLGWSQFRAVEMTGGTGIGTERVLDQRGPVVPQLVREAVQASRTPLQRTPGPIAASFDAQKVGKALSIVLPRMPSEWRLAEMHVIPREDSPAIQLVIDTPDFGRLALFAATTRDVGLTFPTIMSVKDKSSAYWQLANDQYVLTGTVSGEPLESAALELYQTLY